MNRWPTIRGDYFAWLRTFPLLTHIGTPGELPEVIGPSDAPVCLDATFWSQRTHEVEARARQHLTDSEIDSVIDQVAAVIDEDLLRFNHLVSYYGRFFPDGDPGRIRIERETAHSVKRDLAWAATERAIGEPAFFCALLPWYDRGRWPCGWVGEYQGGHVRVL